jgi:hypothetical protein
MILVALEVVLSLLRGISEELFLMGNGVAMGIFFVITCWFFYTAWSFTSVLADLSKKSSAAGTTGTGRNSTMQRIVQHTRLWATLAGVYSIYL